MGRPRNSSNPMRPTRLLKTASSGNVGVMNLHLPPLSTASITRSLEEDLESQARSAISLFGFGSAERAVMWSRVSANSFDISGFGGSNISPSLMLMERVCPIGTNQLLWNTMHNGETITNLGTASNNHPSDNQDTESNSSNGNPSGDEEHGEWDGQNYTHLFASRVLQQYLVKGVTTIPATLEEVIDLLVRSDSDDMETTMQHLVGVKASGSGLIYRRRKKRLRRRHLPTATSAQRLGAKSLSAATMTYESDSSSSSSGGESEESDNQIHQKLNRMSMAQTRMSMAANANVSTKSRKVTNASSAPTATSYMDDYQTLMAETGNRGNLSIKWVVGERAARMFAARVQYCLLDYECIIVNDWDEEDCSPMYVRSIQSCYLPQCQPWMDEFGARPTDLQPTGFMVREAKNRDGFVEIQFVASVLEKAQLPNLSRRAKLRQLVAKIARLEEIVTSRRLSQSLLTHQPLWVRNRERTVCYGCEAKFNISRRRHHCRLCGEICCSDCCPKMDVALPDVGVTSVRVCVRCVRKRRQSSDSIGSASSFSNAFPSSYSPSKSMSGTFYHTPPPPPPPPQPALAPHLQLSSSSSSEYLSSSQGSISSSYGAPLGERKPSSFGSSMLQRFKSG
ncbi:hypothetical protein Poli38472_007909 [Pythium oligandrum]|uniref:FYVE-type domain-containing protein n=1 Tax=Pythium oligandrum TaxID=41045 RepID=A0A8K1FQR8_PYTOL|nr:hypothetical protein Poli38472_007909 [Pythium oligandrum]|eukprot:TMW68237.1 hypothetical protein Poli38472_007909 [Pythium oligandrum]